MISRVSANAPYSAGSVISGKYRLDRLLGEGGMGSVWQAFNLQLETAVAIKLLRDDPHTTDTTELAERLRVEARAAAQLVHPSIVRVFDIGESEAGSPYVVMEQLNGETLGAVLERGALPPARALQLLLPVVEALALAHSRGIVHRDVKPDNIFVAEAAGVIQPKLLDFGIAKVMSGARTGKTSKTLSGTLLGSPDYMSPEQARGRADVDERSDVWAFCVVLYEALAGRPPFRGETYADVLASVILDEPPALSDVDPVLTALVMRGLAKDRETRPASIFELGQLLAAWLRAHGTTVDVTGASLKSKWLDHLDVLSADVPWVSVPRDAEHSTLISVVHSGPRQNTHSSTSMFRARVAPRRWPGALAVSAVALAAVGWAVVQTYYPRDLQGVGSAASVAVSIADSSPAAPATITPVSMLAAEPAKPPEAPAPVVRLQTAPAPPPSSWRKKTPMDVRSAPPRAPLPVKRGELYPPYDPGI